MNTPVSFEIKQLLYDKGWRYELGVDETGYRVEHSLAEQRWNEGDLTYVDITITEIVMWIYEKHGLWTNVVYMGFELKYSWSIDIVTTSGSNWDSYGEEGDICYNSPTEAYEAAIEYTLTKLI